MYKRQAYYVDSLGFADITHTFLPGPEREAAYCLDNDQYLYIQVCDTGYDYTLFAHTGELIDGGQLDAPALSMEEARKEICEMQEMCIRDRVQVMYLKKDETAVRNWYSNYATDQLINCLLYTSRCV